MKKILRFLTVALCFAGFATINAQVLWPTADSATIRASQFSSAAQVFTVTRATPTAPVGFTGWTTMGLNAVNAAALDSTVFEWKASASAAGGAYWGTQRILGSPSRANGAVTFNSDFLDNRGSTTGDGTGPSPSPHIAAIVSPIMNVTVSNPANTDIAVVFHQHFRNFTANTFIEYSLDGGATWSPNKVNVNLGLAANAGTLNPVVASNTDSTKKIVVLPGVTTSANFRLRFTFDGEYYFWTFDDVSVVAISKYYDMALVYNGTFLAIPPSFFTPKPQLEPIAFGGDVKNQGTKPMNNVKLQVNVWRARDLVNVYSATTAAGAYPTSFKSDSVIENRILPGRLAINQLDTGRYIGSYRVIGDSSVVDLNPGNDTFRFTFWVSDTAASKSQFVAAGVGQSNFSKDAGFASLTRNADAFWTAAEPKNYRFGNYYFFAKGVTTTITSLVAGVDAKAAAGRSLSATLYEWKDLNDDGIIQVGERTLVAAADTIVPAAEPSTGTFFIYQLQDINTGKLFYPKDTTGYIAMIEFNAPAPATPAVYLRGGFGNSAAVNYNAMRFVTDSLGKPRYSIILGKNADSDWTTGGYTTQTLVPVVRLNVLPFKFRLDTKDVLSSDNKLNISPNPANTTMSVDIDLVKQMDLGLRIITVEGKLIADQVFEKIQKNNIQVDVSTYANGTYILQLLTAEGILSKRFVVAR